MVDSGRDKAIAAAKKHGKVFVLRGQVYKSLQAVRLSTKSFHLDHVPNLGVSNLRRGFDA